MNMRFLSEDWSLKLFSLVAAVVLFFFVSVENDTQMQVDFRIEYRTADDIMLVSDPPHILRATLQGPWAKFRSFDSAQLEPVVVDLVNSGPGTTRHVISNASIRAPGGMRVVTVLPSEVELTLDRRVERLVEIHADITDIPAFGFEVHQVQFTPNKARLVGPASKMQGLDYIGTRGIQVSGRNESFALDIELRPPAPPMRLLDKRVQAFVIIQEEFTQSTFTNIPVVLEGAPKNTKFEPQKISVTLKGPRAQLEKIDKSSLTAFANITQDVRQGATHSNPTVIMQPTLPERVRVLGPIPQIDVELPPARKIRRR